MRIPRAVFLLAAVLVLASAAHSRAAATDAFDLLAAELRIREAGLTGEADPRSMRQLRAVQRSLSVIERAETLAQDCRAAGATAVLISRTFPSEFTASPEFAAGLGTFVGDVYQRLLDHVFAARKRLADRLAGQPRAFPAGVQRALDAADASIGRALHANGFAGQARHLARAAAAIARGMRIADAHPLR